jgi:hypothetical protein
MEHAGWITPESPSGDSGLACGPSGYRGGGLPNAYQWTPQSHLEAYATVFAGFIGEHREGGAGAVPFPS